MCLLKVKKSKTHKFYESVRIRFNSKWDLIYVLVGIGIKLCWLFNTRYLIPKLFNQINCFQINLVT